METSHDQSHSDPVEPKDGATASESTGKLATYSHRRGWFGRILGVLGFICLVLIVLAPVGLVLSLLSFMSARNHGEQNKLALTGLIGSSILVVSASTIVFYLLFFDPEIADDFIRKVILHPTSLRTDYKPAQLSSNRTPVGEKAASEVAARTGTYRSMKGTYPLMLTDFETNTETSLRTMDDIVISKKPLTKATAYSERRSNGTSIIVSHLVIYACGVTEGNKIGYWDDQANEMMYVYSGNAGTTSTCTIMK